MKPNNRDVAKFFYFKSTQQFVEHCLENSFSVPNFSARLNCSNGTKENSLVLDIKCNGNLIVLKLDN